MSCLCIHPFLSYWFWKCCCIDFHRLYRLFLANMVGDHDSVSEPTEPILPVLQCAEIDGHALYWTVLPEVNEIYCERNDIFAFMESLFASHKFVVPTHSAEGQRQRRLYTSTSKIMYYARDTGDLTKKRLRTFITISSVLDMLQLSALRPQEFQSLHRLLIFNEWRHSPDFRCRHFCWEMARCCVSVLVSRAMSLYIPWNQV